MSLIVAKTIKVITIEKPIRKVKSIVSLVNSFPLMPSIVLSAIWPPSNKGIGNKLNKPRLIEIYEIIIINDQIGILIMTKDKPIQIKYAQLEGKKATDGYTLSKQVKLRIKEQFGN